MKNRLFALLATACVGAAACSSATGRLGDDGPTPLGDVQLVANLVPFDACEDFLAHVKEEGAARVGPYGFEDGFYGWPVPLSDGATSRATATEDATTVGAAPPATNEAASADQESSASEPGFSGTNVQEEGVDEPDLVKTDGTHLYTLTKGRLEIVDLSGATPTRAGSLDLGTAWNHEMLLSGDRVIVVGAAEAPYDDIAGGLDDQTRIGPVPWVSTVVIAQVDVSDPSAPRLAAKLTVDGEYVSARAVGETGRLVIRHRPVFPFLYPSSPGAEKAAEAANRQIIADSTVEDWLPEYSLARGDATSSGTLVDCGRVNRPPEFAGFNTLTVLTVDLAGELSPGNGVAVLAAGETVYASAESLYVATNQWAEPNVAIAGDGDTDILPAPEPDFHTELHQFSIAGTSPAEYLASGTVRGHFDDQFSMSEWDGHLRVATTDGAPWGANETSKSFVTVFERQGDTLAKVGEVADLAPGETIQSVRFLGERGYVVTFRRIDPLFALDLSNHTAPRVVGELKIPGFSSYLQPIGENLLLGIGQDATDEGRTTGMQVSVFDVSDPANPVRRQQFSVEDAYSEAEHEHRSVLWWDETNLLVIPIERYAFDERAQREDTFTGAIALRVDPAAGIDELARITHAGYAKAPIWDEPIPVEPGDVPPTEESIAPGEPYPGWVWAPQIRRSVVVGSSLYTVSESGVLQSDLATLADGTWVGFD